jgi:hypothetical protein
VLQHEDGGAAPAKRSGEESENGPLACILSPTRLRARAVVLHFRQTPTISRTRIATFLLDRLLI